MCFARAPSGSSRPTGAVLLPLPSTPFLARFSLPVLQVAIPDVSCSCAAAACRSLLPRVTRAQRCLAFLRRAA